MSEHTEVQQAISLSLTAGYHLDQEAFDLLITVSKKEDPTRLIELALKKLETRIERPLVISKDLLEETAMEAIPPIAFSTNEISLATGKAKKAFYPYAKETEKKIEVIEDPTNKICSTSSIDEYQEYFQDRFKRIARLLRQRMDARDAGSIKDAFRAAPRSRTKIICMVTKKRGSKHGTLLEVEDLESSAVVLIPQNRPQRLLEQVKGILPDQVVCLNLLKSRKNLLVVEELFLPDIPQKKPRKAREAVYAALISDLHVGSKEFMQDEFNHFVLWLNGKYGDRSWRDVAGLVKYVIIAGDLVDGVGVYPNQIKELTVRNIFDQYKLAAKFLEQIPDYIELVIIPGNHDASRKALPQPALPEEYAEPLFEARNLLSLGNPSIISVHGIEFLLYHGRSLDDVLATAENMSFHSPEKAMRLLLRGRHLAPTYGQRTLIAPEKRDFLVIDRVPDVLHTGHIHIMKNEFYRGTLMVNSGAWQRQTDYQKKLGLKPTPGIIPVVNLQTLNAFPMDFNA